MRTPTTPRGRATYDHLPPLEAIIKAWTEPGPRPDWHRKAQDEVRRAMPVLARALDRAADQRSTARAAERDQAQAALDRVRVALSNHPRACEKYPDDYVIQCGWKSAVLDVQAALDGEQ